MMMVVVVMMMIMIMIMRTIIIVIKTICALLHACTCDALENEMGLTVGQATCTCK